MLGRLLLSGAIVAVSATSGWSQAVLDIDDVGEETITLPEDDVPFVFRSATGSEVTFYGQFNPTWQSFDDGEETNGGVVDNGNWNTRVGFRIVQPMDSVTLRWRFETGLGLRNSAARVADGGAAMDRLAAHLAALVRGGDRCRLRHLSPSARAARRRTARRGSTSSFTFVVSPTDASDGFGSWQFRDARRKPDRRIGGGGEQLVQRRPPVPCALRHAGRVGLHPFRPPTGSTC